MGEEFKDFEVEAPVHDFGTGSHGRKRRNCEKKNRRNPRSLQ